MKKKAKNMLLMFISRYVKNMRSQRFLTFYIEKCHQSLWWKWWYLADIRTSISLAYIGDIQPPIVGISANKNQESVLVEAFFLSSDGCTFFALFFSSDFDGNWWSCSSHGFIKIWWKTNKFYIGITHLTNGLSVKC